MTQDEQQWFVGCVSPKKEKLCRDILVMHGYEVYLPLQKVTRLWTRNRRREVEQMVIPGFIFIRCTEERRKLIFASTSDIFPHIYGVLSRFLMSAANKERVVATVPETQMRQLMFIVGNSNEPVEFAAQSYVAGDRVRVVRGSLMGMEAIVEKASDGASYISIRIDSLGVARVKIDPLDLEKL